MNPSLLKFAYSVIKGIPAERFDLDDICSNEIDEKKATDPHHCGTIACGIGFLAMHPVFNVCGLSLNKKTGRPLLHGEEIGYVEAGAKVFDIDDDESEALFRPTQVYEAPPGYDNWSDERRRHFDKKLWLRRCKDLLGS